MEFYIVVLHIVMAHCSTTFQSTAAVNPEQRVNILVTNLTLFIIIAMVIGLLISCMGLHRSRQEVELVESTTTPENVGDFGKTRLFQKVVYFY